MDAGAVQLQQVWTDPGRARPGNGQRGLRDLVRLLLEHVPRVCLFVRAENEAAIGLYEKIGMEHVLNYRSVLFCEALPSRAPRESRSTARSELVNGDPGVSCPSDRERSANRLARSAGSSREEQIDLCAVTEFERVRETAQLALARP